MSRERQPRSIRRLLGSLLVTLGVLVGGLLVVATLQLRASDVQTDAENQRNRSFRLADSMRRSSNDLTNMVRLHVATGDLVYRDYYEEILAIRSGDAPRPRNNDVSLWDRVLAEGKGFVEYGEPESLVQQMEAADFMPEEFDALNASLHASDELAEIEVEVMDRAAPRIAEGVDESYAVEIAVEYQRLVDADYRNEKGVIIRAIGDFIALVESRTLRELNDARTTSRVLSVVQLAILGGIVVVGLVAMRRARRVLLRPLTELDVATQSFAAGDYGRRVDLSGAAELAALAAAFNSMANAVESDVSRREAAEREAVAARAAAEEANQAKSTFVAAMSHEIRTPMIGVTGMLEVLAEMDLTPDQRSMVATAQGSAEILLQIIGDVLDFSKIEAGKLELAAGPFMVRSVVEAAAQTFVHTASAKGLRLRWEVDETVAAAHVGDALRIRQVLSNFLSNAIKFTSAGGIELRVRVVTDDGARQRLELSVTDTGMGVAPDRQRELFHEYVQADSTMAARPEGTGLGLVICRRLATLMDGDVTMESEPGRGTTLRLTVPLPIADVDDVTALAGPALLTRPLPSRDEAEREGSIVLLVEDHPINRRVLVHQLELIGFHVDSADDGQKGLELFGTGRYGLVLTDVNMPVVDGFELAQTIRRREAERSIERTPIVGLSANVLPEEAARCMAAGMDDFIGKPASMAVLADVLRRLMPSVAWPVAVGDRGAEGLLDRAALDELTGGDPEVIAGILTDYAESIVDDVVALQDALASEDVEAVRRQAHRISGASRTVGAGEVATLAARLEVAATSAGADIAALRLLAETLQDATARVTALLARSQGGS